MGENRRSVRASCSLPLPKMKPRKICPSGRRTSMRQDRWKSRKQYRKLNPDRRTSRKACRNTNRRRWTGGIPSRRPYRKKQRCALQRIPTISTFRRLWPKGIRLIPQRADPVLTGITATPAFQQRPGSQPRERAKCARLPQAKVAGIVLRIKAQAKSAVPSMIWTSMSWTETFPRSSGRSGTPSMLPTGAATP